MTSDACQNSRGRHREYCGDHTLLVSRNAAMIRNASWANLGRRRTDRPNQPIARHASRNSTRDNPLRKVGVSVPGVLSQMVELDSVATMKYHESYSGGR